MLPKILPMLITAVSFFTAIGFHWKYRKLVLRPSFYAGLSTAVVSYLCFSSIELPDDVRSMSLTYYPWNAVLFAFVSGFILAILIGYLMKHAPSLFGK